MPDAILTVEHVGVSFGGRRVLDDVGFALNAGVFCGLIGSNGSGKTTLLRSILGFERPDAGTIRFKSAAGTRSIGYVPQKILFDPYMPLRARDLVALGLNGRRFGLPLASRKWDAAVDAMLRAVQAEEFSEQRIGELSGGQQQRVLIAHALVRNPAVLLLDEPLANLDLKSAAEIVALLKKVCREQGIAVFLSAHDMNPLLNAMDRIVYLASGRAASGSTEQVVRSDVLSRLYGYRIEVLRVHGRVLVIAGNAADGHDPVSGNHAAPSVRLP